jgi:hypothetical protein
MKNQRLKIKNNKNSWHLANTKSKVKDEKQ